VNPIPFAARGDRTFAAESVSLRLRKFSAPSVRELGGARVFPKVASMMSQAGWPGPRLLAC
jgi:hypothetical protein